MRCPPSARHPDGTPDEPAKSIPQSEATRHTAGQLTHRAGRRPRLLNSGPDASLQHTHTQWRKISHMAAAHHQPLRVFCVHVSARALCRAIRGCVGGENLVCCACVASGHRPCAKASLASQYRPQALCMISAARDNGRTRREVPLSMLVRTPILFSLRPRRYVGQDEVASTP